VVLALVVVLVVAVPTEDRAWLAEDCAYTTVCS
jgi:hypothetical protein